MTSEESSLLVATVHEAIYDRFAPHKKRRIVRLVCFVGLLPMFVPDTLLPSIPQMAKDLGLTHATIRSCGVAMSTSLRSLLFWRFVQVLRCSGGMPLGAGVIGDIYKLEERGTAAGAFFGASLVGMTVAPFLGGAAAQHWSWRNLQYFIGVWGLLGMLLIYLSFPETSHPGTLGIGKLMQRRWIHISWVNPLSSLWLLRSPNLFAGCILIRNNIVLLVPMAHTIGTRYGITNEAIFGAHFLPNGLGNLILRATWIGGLFMNGMGVEFVYNPIASYNVDVMHSRSAEAAAATTAMRSLIISAATALVIPSIERIGVLWTNIIAAILALIGRGIIPLMIRYGDHMRASLDYCLTAEQND
ncbi:major facilitator superfamily domain-containing protein [Suillus americanus]|nr:major facilitator superfamily domain-containing protein [Suillus americanus]